MIRFEEQTGPVMGLHYGTAFMGLIMHQMLSYIVRKKNGGATA